MKCPTINLKPFNPSTIERPYTRAAHSHTGESALIRAHSQQVAHSLRFASILITGTRGPMTDWLSAPHPTLATRSTAAHVLTTFSHDTHRSDKWMALPSRTKHRFVSFNQFELMQYVFGCAKNKQSILLRDTHTQNTRPHNGRWWLRPVSQRDSIESSQYDSGTSRHRRRSHRSLCWHPVLPAQLP